MAFVINRFKVVPFALGAFIGFWVLPKSFRNECGPAVYITLFWLLYSLWGTPSNIRRSRSALPTCLGLILSLASCLVAAQLVKGRVVLGRHNNYVPLGLYVGSVAFWVMQLTVWFMGRLAIQ